MSLPDPTPENLPYRQLIAQLYFLVRIERKNASPRVRELLDQAEKITLAMRATRVDGLTPEGTRTAYVIYDDYPNPDA